MIRSGLAGVTVSRVDTMTSLGLYRGNIYIIKSGLVVVLVSRLDTMISLGLSCIDMITTRLEGISVSRRAIIIIL